MGDVFFCDLFKMLICFWVIRLRDDGYNVENLNVVMGG